MALLKFLKGSYSNLSNAAINEGQVLVCGDTGEMFVDVAADKRVKIGDFTVVSNLTALEALDATAVPTSRLYYIEDGNILARSNGTAWIQVNKQPTAEELKTLLGLGSAAYTDSTAYDAAGSAASVREYVGDIPSTATATNIVAYIQEKTAGIATDTALEELTDRVTTAEGEITTLKGDKNTAGSVAKSIDDAITALDLGNTYEAKGEAEKVQTAITSGTITAAKATADADGNEIKTTYVTNSVFESVQEMAGANSEAITAILDGKEIDSFADVESAIDSVSQATESNAQSIDGIMDTLGDFSDAGEGATVRSLISNAKQSGDDAMNALNEYKGGMNTVLAGKQDVIPENTYDAYGSAAQALTDAKAYVNSEDVFHTDITTVNALGGIAAGADLDGMTTHEILNTLLFPYVAFVLGSTSRSAAAATLENGATQTLSSASISITKKSKPITSVKLLNGSTVLGEKTGDDVAAGGTITFSGLGITISKDSNPNLKFTVTDGTTSTDKSVGASTFVYPYYVGECAADATIDETLIEGLTKKVESKGSKTVTHTVENGRMVIAYPKAHGVLKSILDPNNFETIGDYTRSEVSVTGLDGTTQTYYVYASGAATVSGFKVQYKY